MYRLVYLPLALKNLENTTSAPMVAYTKANPTARTTGNS